MEAGDLSGSAWLAKQWNADVSIFSIIKDEMINALFLGCRGLPGVAFLAPWQQPVEQSFVAPLWTLSIAPLETPRAATVGVDRVVAAE